MSAGELVALVSCDLGAIVRGRSLPAGELAGQLDSGVSWVPANHALTPLGSLAEPNPFGSTGDLRLLPDVATRVRVGVDSEEHVTSPSQQRSRDPYGDPLELFLCDIVEIDGAAWECCPRRFLRDALAELARELGVRAIASFEHEFQLITDVPAGLPFSLEAQRRVGAFPAEVMDALEQAGVSPERFMPEFGANQFEIPVASAEGIAAADRAVVFREVVRDVARRQGLRASFAPLPDPAGPGNGVHIHLSLLDEAGAPVLYDASRPACLSELGGRFAAGVLAHADALSAISAPSPASAARLAPHHWSAGAVCLGRQNRETLLRIPPLVSLGGGQPGPQMRLEYRGADATANPYLTLGAVVLAGLDGVRRGLDPPPILDRDPAQLDDEQAREYRVGGLPSSLAQALQALANDQTARGWLGTALYDAFVCVKRAEIDGVAEMQLEQVCRRYGEIY